MTNRVGSVIIRLAIADVAHLVERHLAKVEVASSSLVIRSRKNPADIPAGFLIYSVPGGELFDYQPEEACD